MADVDGRDLTFAGQLSDEQLEQYLRDRKAARTRPVSVEAYQQAVRALQEYARASTWKVSGSHGSYGVYEYGVAGDPDAARKALEALGEELPDGGREPKPDPVPDRSLRP